MPFSARLAFLRGFDSLRWYQHGDVAQPVEQLLHTEKVIGSDPIFTTIHASLIQLDRKQVFET